MDKHNGSTIFILCMFIIFVSNLGDDRQHSLKDQEEKPFLSNLLGSMISVTTTFSSTCHWDKLKTLTNKVHAYLFPPNLDFKSRDEAEVNGGGGAGEKVKVGVAKSLGNSKAAVEESAKTAAKVVGETVQKTKEKIKKSLYDTTAESQAEL